jgi:hypothetical protein
MRPILRPIFRPTLRLAVWLSAAAAMVVTPVVRGQQHAADPPLASAAATTAPSPAQTSAQGDLPAATSGAPVAPQDPLAEAARKARNKQNKESKTPKVFTNDNIPTTGGISTVGSASASGDATAVASDPATEKGGDRSKEEKMWRDKFAHLRAKLDQDKSDADVMQRELGVLNVQYYNDPVKAMQQGLTREDINKKTADIDAKKQAAVADQQAIDDAEDDLRKAGGDPGWAR